MGGLMLKDNVLSEIVQMLESEGTFTEVVYNILKKANSYLKTTNASILQISADRKSVGTIIDYRSEYVGDIHMNDKSIDVKALCGDTQMYTSTTDCNTQQLLVLNGIGVELCATTPIYINEALAMYYAVFDSRKG